MERKVIFCVGVPASGKSTWSKEFVKKNNNFVRVCRDDYRYMFKDVGWFNDDIRNKLENIITINVESDIQRLLFSDFDVIIDETNLDKKRLVKMMDSLVNLSGVESLNIKFKIFDVDKEELLKRDSERERSVGVKVIDKMYDNFSKLIKDFNFEKYGEII
jgi:predicted kinase